METIQSLNEKIEKIKCSIEYQTLITRHRGPSEDGRLRELNMRINAFELQKKMLVSPQECLPGRNIPASKVGVIKAVPKGRPRAPKPVPSDQSPIVTPKPAPKPIPVIVSTPTPLKNGAMKPVAGGARMSGKLTVPIAKPAARPMPELVPDYDDNIIDEDELSEEIEEDEEVELEDY